MSLLGCYVIAVDGSRDALAAMLPPAWVRPRPSAAAYIALGRLAIARRLAREQARALHGGFRVTDAIDEVADLLLERLLGELRRGDISFTVVSIDDDDDGQGATLAWGPRGKAPPTTATRTTPPPFDLEMECTSCPQCENPAEAVGDDNGGGFYCRKCDLTFEP